MKSALPRVSFALAALSVVHGLQLALRAASQEPQDAGATALIVLHATVAVAALLIGWLAASRRLPGWRRQGVLGSLLIIALALAGLRAGLLNEPMALMEAPVIAVAAAALMAHPGWWLVALVSVPATFVVSVILAASTHGWSQLAATALWLQAAIAIALGIGSAAWLHRGRLQWLSAIEDARSLVGQYSVRDFESELANQRGLEMAAVPMIEHAKRAGQAVHCLAVDFDALAQNGTGETENNAELLQAVAASLVKASRSTDVVARYSEGMFMLVGPGTGASPLELERRIRNSLKGDYGDRSAWDGRLSVGSATLVPWDEGGLEALLTRAEADLSLRRSLRRKADAAKQMVDK